MVNESKKIYGALLAVQEGLANIPKNGVMSFGGTSYKYLKADDVQEMLNPLLTANKIIVNSQYRTRDGERGNRPWIYVDLVLTYISAEDGSEFPSIKATGESNAGDDKSVNKALTQAIKNAHRSQFQFASGEPEPDGIVPTGSVDRQTPAQQKIARAATPAASEADKIKDVIQAEFIATKLVEPIVVKTLSEKVAAELNTDNKSLEVRTEVLKRLRAGEVA